MYIATSLTNPRSREFIDAFNRGLAEIKASGTYQKILDSYGPKVQKYRKK